MSKLFLFLAAALFVVSLFVRVIFTDWNIPGLFFLISSLVVLACSIAFDWRAFYEFFTLQSTRKGLSLGARILILGAILVGINYGMSYYPTKIDFSPSKVHSLSAFSKKIARSFDDKVEFLYFYVPTSDTPTGEDSRNALESMRIAVKKYQDENPHIVFAKHDLKRFPEWSAKFNLNSLEEALFVTYKDRRERYFKNDETSMTQALLRLLKGRKTIYFSVGHGEFSMEESRARGISALKKEVERLFYDTLEVNLENEGLPNETAALVIIGPERGFSQKAKDKIKSYLEKGGRVFISFDPVQDPDAQGFLEPYGLKMEKGIVHLAESALANMGTHIITGLRSDQEHPMLENIHPESPVMFYVTGSLKILPDAESKGKIIPLLVTPGSAILREGYTKSDRIISKGPFNLMVSVQLPSQGELIVASDSDLFANQYLYETSNATLMFSLFGHLSKDDDAVKVPSTESAPKRDFLVTSINYKLYVGLFLLPLPLALFALAGFFWFRRRWL